MLEFGNVFGAILIGLMGVGPVNERLVTPEYSCQKPSWVKTPEIVGGHFVGKVAIACTLKGEHGGGFPHLRESMEDYLVETAETVHSGPQVIHYKGMEGVHYEVTMKFNSESGKSVRIRGNSNLASNLENKLTYDFFSTLVQGEGSAKYMKMVNILAEVTTEAQAGWYKVIVAGDIKVEKPMFAPGSMFISEVKKEVESRIEAQKESVVTEIANNI